METPARFVNRDTRKKELEDLLAIYDSIKIEIENRLGDFRTKWEEGTDEEIFAELVFCLLTPQSKARTCWLAVESIVADGLLVSGEHYEILEKVCTVRFKNNKTGYILEARQLFIKNNDINIKKTIKNLGEAIEIRSWLVRNVKGMGYKEASHFLRNIGMGDRLAILDRHILRNLVYFGVIPGMPKTISPKRYLEIEEKMLLFSREISIPLDHLDILLWYKEAGEIFK